jgi:hypothetical protein
MANAYFAITIQEMQQNMIKCETPETDLQLRVFFKNLLCSLFYSTFSKVTSNCKVEFAGIEPMA